MIFLRAQSIWNGGYPPLFFHPWCVFEFTCLHAANHLACISVKVMMERQTASSLVRSRTISWSPWRSADEMLSTVSFPTSSSWSFSLLPGISSRRNTFCMVAVDSNTSCSWKILTTPSCQFRCLSVDWDVTSFPHPWMVPLTDEMLSMISSWSFRSSRHPWRNVFSVAGILHHCSRHTMSWVDRDVIFTVPPSVADLLFSPSRCGHRHSEPASSPGQVSVQMIPFLGTSGSVNLSQQHCREDIDSAKTEWRLLQQTGQRLSFDL